MIHYIQIFIAGFGVGIIIQFIVICIKEWWNNK
jgi:hypothetical protein